jgi:hypothetical protein
MDMYVLFFPQGNDVVVTARFPTISDGTGQTATFYYKNDKMTPDSDPSTITYQSDVVPDDGNPGATMSQFTVPSSDTQFPGAYWWRIDVTDSFDTNRTAGCGTLLVEAVL